MRASTEKAYRERILRVLVHIQENLDAALSLEDLAAVSLFSPFHFHRVFRAMVGESVMEHLRRLRLERAAQRLKFKEQPVTEVAFDAGYETLEAFSRAFRAMFGDPPSRFREKHRELPFSEVSSGVHYRPDQPLEGFRWVRAPGDAVRVRIEEVREMQVAFVRHVGSYDGCGQAWQKLMGWAGTHRILGPGMTVLGIPHDDPEVTAPEKLRYDACLVVRGEVPAEGEVGLQRVAGGDYATATHRGPLDKVGATYLGLFGIWLPASGREPRSAPCFEIYRNYTPMTPPEDLWTDVYVPLETPESKGRETGS